jgi:hypothetical protein
MCRNLEFEKLPNKAIAELILSHLGFRGFSSRLLSACSLRDRHCHRRVSGVDFEVFGSDIKVV